MKASKSALLEISISGECILETIFSLFSIKKDVSFVSHRTYIL